MPVLLNWNDTNQTEDGHRVYRSTSPMDVNALPAPLVSLGPNITSYQDDAVSDGVTYYYIVSAYKGTSEAFSAEVSVVATQSNIPTANMEIWYKFSDVSGSIVPDSAGNFDGTLNGNATQVAGDLGGSAIDFDGAGDYIDSSYKTSGGTYTISAWVKVRAFNGANANIYAEVQQTTNSYGALLWVVGSSAPEKIQFGHFKSVSGNFDAIEAPFTYLNETIHVCAVRENGVEHRLYINGQLVASGACANVTNQASYTGYIGGDRFETNRWLDGLIDRDFRIYNAALSALEVQQLYEEHGQAVPFVLNEQFTINTEAEDINDFNITSGSPTIVGSEVVLPANNSARVEMPFGVAVPQTGDFLYYFKARCDQAAGQYGYLYLYDGATVLMNFIFNYNMLTGSAETGTVAVSVDAGTTKRNLETGVDTSVAREYAIHADRNRGAISFYRRDPAGGWVLLNHIPWTANWLNADKVMFGKGTGSNSLEMGLDYFSVGRPNFVSIGDSITAGHNFFDPDPDFYAGIDNVKNSWQGHWTYSGLRNNFMVNKGIGSQDTGEVLARITEATSHGARYVFLSACNNDYGVPLTQTQRTNNIQGSVDAILNAGARCVLYNAVYPNADQGAGYPASGDYYKDWWDNYRSQITDTYQMIDTMSALADVSGYIDPAYCESDGVHPNATGYGVMGDYFETQFSHTP